MLSNEVASLVLVLKNVSNLVKAVVLNFQLFFYCKDMSVIFQLSVTRFEQLSFYCKETSAIKKSPRQRLQNMMRSMTSYEVVYIRQRGLVSSLKYATRSVSRELEAEMFHCLNPQKPHMCDREDRMRTFP